MGCSREPVTPWAPLGLLGRKVPWIRVQAHRPPRAVVWGGSAPRLSTPKSCFPAHLKSYPIPAEASISLAWSWAAVARVSKVLQPEEGAPRPGGLESDPTAHFCTGSGLCSSPSDFLGGWVLGVCRRACRVGFVGTCLAESAWDREEAGINSALVLGSHRERWWLQTCLAWPPWASSPP